MNSQKGEKPLRITILVDNPNSWYCQYAERLVTALRREHEVFYLHDSETIPDGDCALLLSCSRLIRPEVLSRNRHNVVIHSSPLPRGRGFAPLSWQVLEGKSEIQNTMFEAAEAVDAGPIYGTNTMTFDGHELIEELREVQAARIAELVEQFVRAWPDLHPAPQSGEPSFYPRRRAADSRLDAERSLAEQFDLLRIVDNERYPAFFVHRGHRYTLKIYDDGPVAT